MLKKLILPDSIKIQDKQPPKHVENQFHKIYLRSIMFKTTYRSCWKQWFPKSKINMLTNNILENTVHWIPCNVESPGLCPIVQCHVVFIAPCLLRCRSTTYIVLIYDLVRGYGSCSWRSWLNRTSIVRCRSAGFCTVGALIVTATRGHFIAFNVSSNSLQMTFMKMYYKQEFHLIGCVAYRTVNLERIHWVGTFK